MGVFSYLNIKKPASMIWKALSPSRDLGEAQGSSGGSGSDLSVSGEDVHMVKVRVNVVKTGLVLTGWLIPVKTT